MLFFHKPKYFADQKNLLEVFLILFHSIHVAELIDTFSMFVVKGN